jgi:hypothetical protein
MASFLPLPASYSLRTNSTDKIPDDKSRFLVTDPAFEIISRRESDVVLEGQATKSLLQEVSLPKENPHLTLSERDKGLLGCDEWGDSFAVVDEFVEIQKGLDVRDVFLNPDIHTDSDYALLLHDLDLWEK